MGRSKINWLIYESYKNKTKQNKNKKQKKKKKKKKKTECCEEQ